MVTLLIIADDFTGALDTGVQFAASGANTRVVTSPNYDIRRLDPSVQVLVIDAETRHLPPKEAYDIVYDITKRAADLDIPYLYKKTDSALRGNIGSELTAMMDAAGGKTLSFLPAFPKMKRWTRDGIHYIDGMPVSESVFGKDPFEPVTCSYIPQIIEMQSKVKVRVKAVRDINGLNIKNNEYKQEGQEIIVWDAKTDSELETLGSYLYETDQMHLTAGCAGFAAVLPKLLGLKGTKRQDAKLTPKLLIICGSVNPITAAQLDYAEKHGLTRYRLKPEEMLTKGFWSGISGQDMLARWEMVLEQESCLILDSNDMPGKESKEDYAKAQGFSLDEMRVRIATAYGHILKALMDRGLDSTLLITGGDTLLGCMEELGIKEMEPVSEVAPGAVLSEFTLENKKYQVISKSGGFGQETLLADLAKKITGKN